MRHIKISLAVGPNGECLTGLDGYTFFYSKGMGAFTEQSKSVMGIPKRDLLGVTMAVIQYM